MKIVETVFIGWAILIMLWWAQAVPESAPQQAALAGQALVLLVGPYVIMSTLQRGQSRQSSEKRSVTQRAEGTTEGRPWENG